MYYEQRCLRTLSPLLGQELQHQNIIGEILVSGDVIVLLDIHSPKIRRDLDAYLAGDDGTLSFPKTISDGLLSHNTCRSAMMDVEKWN